MLQLLEVMTTLCAALLVGNELSVAVFFHPTLTRLPDMVHAPAAKALAYLLGRVMPFGYALVLILTTTESLLHRPSLQTPGLFFSLSSGLWALSIVYTMAGPVSISNRIAPGIWTACPKIGVMTANDGINFTAFALPCFSSLLFFNCWEHPTPESIKPFRHAKPKGIAIPVNCCCPHNLQWISEYGCNAHR
jgi:hypothetical protein